eukprot:scaffold494_cov26-Tisochrysis_lutea.AAC.1
MKEGLAPAKRRLLDRLPSYPDWLISSHRLLLVLVPKEMHVLCLFPPCKNHMGVFVNKQRHFIQYSLCAMRFKNATGTSSHNVHAGQQCNWDIQSQMLQN